MSGPSSQTPIKTIAVTAAVATAATTAAILTYQSLRRDVRKERLKKAVGSEVEAWEREHSDELSSGDMTPNDNWADEFKPMIKRAASFKPGEYDDSLVREQLSRNYSFLGEDAMKKVRNSYVVVVGCGGVGSWAATMLLRSGVGKLLLIDFDMTTLSSLNRHACATLEDVGTPKAVAMQKYFHKIAPWAQVDIKVGLWKKGEESERWLDGADYVVDAIDNIETKVDLLTYCHKNNLKVFASMGAGAKADPTRVQIADISNTYEDPLARSVRSRLRKNGIKGGIPTVYSTEIPSEVKLLPLPEDEFKKGSVKELGAFDDFRVRILPVLGPLPAIFGLHAATYIIEDLAGKPLEDAAEIRHRRKIYAQLERGLSERDCRAYSKDGLQRTIEVNAEDMAFIFEDVNHGRTTFDQAVIQKPAAVHWDPSRPLAVDNVIIMDVKGANKHEKEVQIGGKKLEEVYTKDQIDIANRRCAEARKYMIWRRG